MKTFINNFLRYSLLGFYLIFSGYSAYAETAALLPNGKQTFLDSNGNPLTAGTVDFYTPGTTTRKTTWQDPTELIPNANPVVLDAAGRAIIYGFGSYRQIVKDKNGNIIWDQLTASAGTGGSSTTVGDGNLVGTILPWAGLIAPPNYLFGYGQEISRATYPEYFTAVTLQSAAFCTSASPILTGLADTTQIPIGSPVEAICVAAGTTVLSKTATTVTVSNNASLTTNLLARFFPFGNGNGTTTFNVVDLRGNSLAGRSNMGGTASSHLANGTGLGLTLGINNFAYSNAVKTQQILTSGTAATYTTPAGASRIVITMQAGGGGGGGSGAGDSNGGTGGTTSFNSITVIGGGGGQAASSGNVNGGGIGGTGGSGSATLRLVGSAGNASGTTSTDNMAAGSGGAGFYGAGAGLGGGAGGETTGGAGGTNTGAGGGGAGLAVTSGVDPGAGGGAGEFAQFTINSPAATYTYTVGAAGTAGTGARLGGAGGSGIIIVDEYYATTTDFTSIAAGTLQTVSTLNFIVKVTPDTSSSVATGVASLGGMTGVIACGSGLTCTSNTISVLAGSGTVNSGTAGQLTWYAGTGTAVSGNSSANISSGALTLGQSSSVIGQLKLAGNSSGTATITPQAAAGTPTLTVGTSSGTIAATASSPLAIDATTGNVTCATCATTSGGGSLSATAPIVLTGNVISITGAALTKTDDTNVTLTLGGSAASALVTAASLTLGWTGQLSLTRGGTNASLTASNGGAVYSTGSALAILAGTATANLPLLSGSSTTPSWATVSHPTSANSGGVAYFSSSTVMASSAALTVNQIMIGGGAGSAPTTFACATSTTVVHGGTPPTCAQVSLSADVTGNLPNANLASQTANTVLGALTATTPSGLAVPSCSTASSALTWTSGGGFGCNTISGSGTVNSGTAGQMAYYATSTTAVSGNANANISSGALSLGVNTSVAGSVKLFGATSGDATIQVAAVAGTSTVFQLPASNGTNGFVLSTNGSGVTSWIAATGTGTITSITPGNGLTSTLTATAPGSAITSTGTLSAASLVNAQTGTTYTIVDGDRSKLVTHSNGSSIAVTLPQAGAASAFQAGWFYFTQNLGAGTVTITPTTSTIDGAATLTLPTSNGVAIYSDGTNYFTLRGRPTNNGTVTSITCNGGLTGGAITTSGTCAVDIATGSNFFSGTANKIVDAAVIYQAETTSTFNATQALDFNTFYNTKVTLTGNITSFSCSNQKAGQSGAIRFIQDGTGSRTLPATMGCNMKFAGGTQPVLTTTASAVDVLVYSCSATTYCVGNLIKNVQ